MSGRNGKRGARGGGILPSGMGRVERRAEAGWVVYCKCKNGFRQWPNEKLRLMSLGDERRYKCKDCGAHKPEWRCPVHKLKAEPTEHAGEKKSAGCPRCGRAPKEQRLDAYMTAVARDGGRK